MDSQCGCAEEKNVSRARKTFIRTMIDVFSKELPSSFFPSVSSHMTAAPANLDRDSLNTQSEDRYRIIRAGNKSIKGSVYRTIKCVIFDRYVVSACMQ